MGKRGGGGTDRHTKMKETGGKHKDRDARTDRRAQGYE